MKTGALCLGFATMFVLVACGGQGTAPLTGQPPTALLPAASSLPPASTTPPAASPTLTPPRSPTPASTTTATTAPTQTPAPGAMQLVSIVTGSPNPFSGPFSVALDSLANLYVADSGHDRVQKFGPEGKFLLAWGKHGTGAGEFNFYRVDSHDSIGSVATDAQDNVYVVDTGNFRIQKFDSNGKFLLMWGSQGGGKGQFLDPLFVAVDRRGNVYVDDDGVNTVGPDRVLKFNSDGKFITEWGSHGTGDGQFNGPGQLAADAQGDVYVVDFSNHRVQKFDSRGKFLLKWGRQGGNDGDFDYPSGIVVDAQGNVYVSNAGSNDNTQHRWVQKFTSDGTFVSKWGSYGNSPGQFIHAYGLGIDGQGNVYVVDTATNRIEKFRPR